MLRDPEAVQHAADVLLGCVCAELETVAARVQGQPGCPCVACVHPGAPAWDYCCDCQPEGQTGGQLTVSVEQIYPTTRFPEPANATHRCLPAGTGLAADLVVTLLRCAPTVDSRGNPPSCDVLSRTARIVHVDMLTVYTAATCCFPEALGSRRPRQILVRDHRAVGPDGGCVGSELRLAVDLGAPCGCFKERSP